MKNKYIVKLKSPNVISEEDIERLIILIKDKMEKILPDSDIQYFVLTDGLDLEISRIE